MHPRHNNLCLRCLCGELFFNTCCPLHLRRQRSVRNGNRLPFLDRTGGHHSHLPSVERHEGIGGATVVEHRRRQIQPDCHFGVGQWSYVATDRGLRATKGGHGKGVRANLGVRFGIFDQRVVMIRGEGWDRATFYKERRAVRRQSCCCCAPLLYNCWCDGFVSVRRCYGRHVRGVAHSINTKRWRTLKALPLRNRDLNTIPQETSHLEQSCDQF